ncbi:MAG: hypothetical protein JWM95_4423 [Gemmatimonadetes bacterium]|nr:hypothetical protein [Gemmatimonadota bacterium]
MSSRPGTDAGMDPILKEIVPGLYQIGDPAVPVSGLSTVYSYLLTAGTPATVTSPLTLNDTWLSGAPWNGWYLFLSEPIEDAAAFVSTGRTVLPTSPAPDWRGMVWTGSTNPSDVLYAALLVYQDDTSRTFLGGTSVQFNFGPFGILLAGSPNITYADGTFTFFGPMLEFLQLVYGGQPQQQGFRPYTNDGNFTLTIEAAGIGAGALELSAAVDSALLTQNLGCGFQFFYPPADGIGSLYYPLWPPPPPPGHDADFLGFQLLLHPVLPTDPAWTMLVYDTSGSNIYQENSKALTSGTFRTTAGEVIELDLNTTPSPLPGGLAFCAGPSSSSPGETSLYLAPAGTFRVVSVGSALKAGSDPAGLMCGLSAQEWIELQAGDNVALVPGMPAFAPQFTQSASPPQQSSPAGNTPSVTLDATYTTSWLQYPLQATAPRRYFGQPSRSIYYAVTNPGYSTPVTSLLASLEPQGAFPVVPYGGTYASTQFNAGVTPTLLAAYEGAVLSTERHAITTAKSDGPRFSSSGSTSGALRALAASPPDAWTSLTPQGFLVELDGEGTWQHLLLARDPASSPARYLSFDAPAGSTVNRHIATTVLQDQLFLVISNAANIGDFSNVMMLEGFEFLLDVAKREDPDTVNTVLIFKFNPHISLSDLARSPDLWASRDTFITNLALTQQVIIDALDVAGVGSPHGITEGSAIDPFAAFKAMAEDATWTGILALNCAIDGNGMPPDLQMLLGGIPGQLRAHHLGIDRNRVSTLDGVQSLEESSLFGLILYPPPGSGPPAPPSPATPLDYQVESLQVLFANSAITQFAAEVGLTIGSLFGREVVTGASPSGHLLRMPGEYQHQGGNDSSVGIVLFHVDPTDFEFPCVAGSARVLESVTFQSGSLTPVSSASLSPGTHVVARFSLEGSLRFRQFPFASTAATVDLFSYDVLPFTGLHVMMEFDLDATGALVPWSRVLTMDMSQFIATSDGATTRTGSLLRSFPLKVSGFQQAKAGQALSPSTLGAQVIHSLQLEGTASATGSPAEGSPSTQLARSEPATDYPNVTTTPQYVLQYEMPLGNLGALSDVVSLTATLNLGWGPSSLIPDADAAAVFVQLPGLSAGYGSFDLQGIVKTTFGDANLLKVELPHGDVYAILFNNIQLSVLGFAFPSGIVVDFLLFGGQSVTGNGGDSNSSNIAWYLSAQQKT